jgi:penicillin-binding protein 1A
MMKKLAFLFSGLVMLGLLGLAGIYFVFQHYGKSLPDYQQLATYEPPVVTRVHAGDGKLMVEYAQEKRVFVPIDAIPKNVIHAFLAAEDKNFYTHPGIDFLGIARASVQNLMSVGQNRRPVGASTITQQVAKNFLLTNEVSIERKVKEAILAFRIEQALTKDRILELYLNEIYLGFGSYGVAAAGLNYFNKSLDELTVGEAAYLAALPKAPNNYHPYRQTAAAKARRDWVIDRMVEEGFVTAQDGAKAQAQPFVVRSATEPRTADADFFAEEVRRALYDRYGEAGLYRGGLSVRTSLDSRLQEIADRSLRDGLIRYDRRHGWRGPLAKVQLGPKGENWQAQLAAVNPPAGIQPWKIAVVLAADQEGASIGLEDGSKSHIPFSELRWAREWRPGQLLGPAVRTAADVVHPGDVVAVAPLPIDEKTKKAPDGYSLQQIPGVNGAIVALDPHTGRVLAMSGGFSYELSQFNRATQAMRQPGSSFKPFVYLAALDSGFTPSSLILDAPFVVDQGPGLGLWKPGNYELSFLGPSTLRTGIEKSRNLMTVRLAQTIGMNKVADYAERFGIVDRLQPVLSMSLGAGETTVLRMATAYAMLANGGKRITPTLIDRIQDRHGETIYRHDERPCPQCEGPDARVDAVPRVPDTREQIGDPRTIYQMVSILQGVVQRGTGRRLAQLGRPLAGKTGTSNDFFDTWFVGFSPDFVAAVYVGFDTPRTMGKDETGSSVAVPIFYDFMKDALKNQPAVPFRVPPGIRQVRVDATTGQPANARDKNAIWESFLPGTEPTGRETVLDGSGNIGTAGDSTPGMLRPTASGGGGLY